jgi:hypothetical protein
MKFKFPKKIVVGDVVWKIKYNKTNAGGSFEYDNHTLTIGTKYSQKNPTRTLNSIIHELKEIIQVENDTRLERGNNISDYVFVYDHRDHTDICRRLAGLLDEFIK